MIVKHNVKDLNVGDIILFSNNNWSGINFRIVVDVLPAKNKFYHINLKDRDKWLTEPKKVSTSYSHLDSYNTSYVLLNISDRIVQEYLNGG